MGRSGAVLALILRNSVAASALVVVAVALPPRSFFCAAFFCARRVRARCLRGAQASEGCRDAPRRPLAVRPAAGGVAAPRACLPSSHGPSLDNPDSRSVFVLARRFADSGLGTSIGVLGTRWPSTATCRRPASSCCRRGASRTRSAASAAAAWQIFAAGRDFSSQARLAGFSISAARATAAATRWACPRCGARRVRPRHALALAPGRAVSCRPARERIRGRRDSSRRARRPAKQYSSQRAANIPAAPARQPTTRRRQSTSPTANSNTNKRTARRRPKKKKLAEDRNVLSQKEKKCGGRETRSVERLQHKKSKNSVARRDSTRITLSRTKNEISAARAGAKLAPEGRATARFGAPGQ